MIVDMCMSRDVETIHPEASLFEGIRQMTARRIRRLVVTQGRSIVGIVCHRDIVGAFPAHINPFSPIALEASGRSPGSVEHVMKHPVITIGADQPIEHAAELMIQNHIGGLPVTTKNRLGGIITESDIFRTFSRLISVHSKATRITFDLTADEEAFAYLVNLTRELGLELLSFVSFHEGDRRLAVAHVQGVAVSELIDRLWNSGHAVANVIRNTP